MELCTSQAITSNLSLHTLFTSNNFHLPSETPLRFNRTSIRRTNPGMVYFTNSSLRSTSSEEASSGPSQYLGKERGVATLEDVQPFGKKSYAEFVQEKEPEQDSSVDRQAAALGFLDNIDMELASKYAFSALLVDVVSLIALWLATAVVGAIDSIPVFPKVMEVVGLSYTIWFSTRYLLFKENREELFAEIEEIKQKVIG
ncbi:protein CURVATURE THYLAKOID 1D, chloroplastic-like [Rhododendron vialii]|uniref:protein CURVATURE THYLAKOID 1D, chloroplastic-like n=1 Tax=Rhododendron vialii TaxID=182163 RepID=UPI00265DB4B6|nr:protein CURVATURE THYLAKOID 1D, chloroplastic-like [Rhododendron vialii]